MIDEIFEDQREVLIFPETLPIGEKVRLKRIHDGFRQADLASLLGMDIATLCRIETGQLRISGKRLKRIEDYLYKEWYCDGELVEIIDQGGTDNDEL